MAIVGPVEFNREAGWSLVCSAVQSEVWLSRDPSCLALALIPQNRLGSDVERAVDWEILVAQGAIGTAAGLILNVNMTDKSIEVQKTRDTRGDRVIIILGQLPLAQKLAGSLNTALGIASFYPQILKALSTNIENTFARAVGWGGP